MRVPTYQRQTAATNKTGAMNFSVRANPGALSAGLTAVANLAGEVEKQAISWYATEQKLRRQDELSKAETELDLKLAEQKGNQQTRDPSLVLAGDPSKNEMSFVEQGQSSIDLIASNIQDKKVRSAFLAKSRDTLAQTTISVNQTARNRLIDQRVAQEYQRAAGLEDKMVMGNSTERAAAQLSLFGGIDGQGNQIVGVYNQMAVDGLIKETEAFKLTRSAEKSVLVRAQKADAAILESNTNKRVLIAGDTARPLAERQAAVANTVKHINEAIAKNTITPAAGQEMADKATDDAVRAIGLSVMTRSDDATTAIMGIISGNSEDAVLSELLTTMDPSAKQKAFTDMFNLGNKIDTERREQEEAAEEKADLANNQAYESIINVDQSDENALAAAKRLHSNLLKDKYYDATSRKAAETVLGLNKKPKADGKQESKRSAIKTLTKADNDNILSQALVESLTEDLSLADYKSFMDKARTEGKEGRTAAKALISSRLRYNEFKDSNNALGDAADQMFQSSMFELDDWLNTPKQDDGGAGATYQETVKKAREIIKENDVEFKRQYKEALVEYVNSQTSLFPGLVVDPARPVESTLEYLRSLNTPNDTLVKGVVRTIKSYRKLLVDN